jgi:hypothetical protein
MGRPTHQRRVRHLRPESTGRIGSVAQLLIKADGSGGWVEEEVPFTALYSSLGQLHRHRRFR